MVDELICGLLALNDRLCALLAIAPYTLLTTWALFVAAVFFAMVRMRMQGRHYLWGAAAFTLLATFFFALAVSGGADPFIPRRQLALPIRLVAMGVLVTGYGWIALWARAHIVIERRQRRETSHGN